MTTSKSWEDIVSEPEFVLVDEPASVPGDLQVRPLKRAGRRGARKSVLVRVDATPRRSRFVVLALLLIAIGVAAFVVVKRRSAAPDHADRAPLLEDDEALAMREPPIVAL